MSAGHPLIQLSQVTKVFKAGRSEFHALRGVDLDIGRGEMVALIGPSGSGKTTILNMITGIDKPSAGTVTVDGRSISKMGENDLARWRGVNVGIIFQFFQLMPTLTALENVILPMDFRGSYRGRRRERALERLRLVGLEEHAHQLPSELSGGEQQRVAIARALANDPPIILADEPTGNLDTDAGVHVIGIFRELHRHGKTVLVATHSPELAQSVERVVQVHDGRILDGATA
ncbi:MAG TPA: ABC transporter ATP-binding protein [Dehalococcoidia bacterium]|nr:ABC transporter ATP-binding protein [Dehalococcoidia bacterium]